MREEVRRKEGESGKVEERQRERERVGVDSSTFVCAGLQFFIGLW